MHAGGVSLDDWPADPVEEAGTLIENGRAAEAAARLCVLLDEGRGGLLARLQLTRALIADGRPAEAVTAARDLTQLAPQWPDAAIAFGRALIANNALPTGIAEFQRALRLDRDCAAAELALAEAWTEAGEPDRAAQHLDRAGGMGGADAARIGELRARLAAMAGAGRSDAGYVRHLFDQFAGDYDQRMRGALAYRAPEILLEMAGMTGGRPRKVATLDLGCGTGLAAPVFRPFASRLTGVDLSPQMIAQAGARGLYDDLVTADVESFLFETKTRFGRVIAADVFVYIGDLTHVFAGVRRVLRPGGQFLFTVERHEGDAPFVLQETRRWAHSEACLRNLAATHGFDLRGLMHCTPRVNKGVPIPGLVAALAAP